MKASYFQPIKYSTKARREFNIGSFKGVDLTSPTFDVASNRALLLQNFVRKGDMLEKRQGLDEIYQASEVIYNVWDFKNYIVLHVGSDILVLGQNYNLITKFESVVKEQKISAINRNDKLYIFGGIYLYILEESSGTFNLKRAMDEAYIPTTTIGIGASNLDVSYDTNRQTYDDWNLLTPYHTNELTSGYPDSDLSTYTFNKELHYILDSDIKKYTSYSEHQRIVSELSRCKLQIDYYEGDILRTVTGKFGFAPMLSQIEDGETTRDFSQSAILITNSTQSFYSDHIWKISRGEDGIFATVDSLPVEDTTGHITFNIIDEYGGDENIVTVYRCKCDETVAQSLTVGRRVIVTGKLRRYEEDGIVYPQVDSNSVLSLSTPTGQEESVMDALYSIYLLNDNEVTSEAHSIVGYISEIVTPFAKDGGSGHISSIEVEGSGGDRPSFEDLDASGSFESINYTGSVKVYGYISMRDLSKFVLLNNWGNSSILKNNVEITFITDTKDYNDLYTSDYINKCTFAVSYTDTYSQNRVIITGNENYKNMDWWNENLNVFALQDDFDYNPNIKNDDLLYFPSENNATYGSANKELTGYGLHADGKLMVFKENSNDELVSAYIRAGTQINQKYNEVTGTYSYDYKLDLKASNKGAVPVNRYSIVSYKGYIVFLGDDKKVNIVVNGDKSFATTIYSQSISHQIEKALNEYSLDLLKEKAFMFTFKEFVYLIIEDTIFALIYEKTSADEDYSFEWYIYKTNILYDEEYFTEISTIKDELCLGTNLGSLFKVGNIANNFYGDHRYIELSNSEFTENVIESSKANVVEVGDYITSDYYFALPEIATRARTINYRPFEAPSATVEICTVVATDYLIALINQIHQNEDKIYTYDSEGVLREATVLINEGSILIQIPQTVVTKTEQVSGSSLSVELFGLSTFGADTHLYVKQNENYKIKVKSKDGTSIGYALEFENTEKSTQFNALGETVHSGYIEKLMPIESYYITSPLFFGTLSRYKNIYSYTISNDTNKPSELNLAIIKNNIPFKYNSKIATEENKYGLNIGEAKFSSSMSFDLLDLESMNLDQDYIAVSAYTKYRNIFRQRYTNFVFYNKNFTNSVLSKMTLVYTITSPVVGGD